MAKISVIVPVYNVENYIEKCLQSLYNQTMKDLEIILVNDGTKDNSETVIKEFINNHPKMNIKYFKKENGGLASARNYGIRYATGKYISFIDPDDYLDNQLYKKLETYIDEEIDLIKFKMKTVDEQGKVIKKIDGPVFEKCSGEEAYKRLCIDEKYLDPACIYLYRKEFFIKNKFKYNFTYHEDFGLTSLIIVNAKSVVSTNIYGYYYLQTNNSLTRNMDYSKNVKRAKDMLAHYDNMIIEIKKANIKKSTKNLVKRYYTNGVILKAETLKDKDLENYIKEIKKRKMYNNIKPYNLKQLIKKIILKVNVKLYLKMR